MKPPPWAPLVRSLKHGRCILVLGPEVAADWSDSPPVNDRPYPATFADALKEKLESALRENDETFAPADNLAGVAQQFEDTKGFGFGAPALRSQAGDFYASLRLKPSTEHKALASLPLPLIVSTSQDLLVSDALTQAGKAPVVLRYNLRGDRRDSVDFSLPTLSAPVIYHLFGTFRDRPTLLLSENDLLDFLAKLTSKQLPNSLLRHLQRDDVSLLFIGFALRFWYQRVLLKALIRSVSTPSQANSAMALEPLLQTIPDPERTQTILYYQRGTCVEVIDDSISPFVSGLLQKLEQAGGVTVETAVAAAGPEVPVFLSYANEDRELALAVKDAMEQEGLTPWVDTNNLRGGEEWGSKIKEAIETVAFVLVLVTPDLVGRIKGFVFNEIDAALEEAKSYQDSPFVIPLRSDRLQTDARILKLSHLHEKPLRDASLRDDVAAVAKELRREAERRRKQRE